MYLIGLYQKFWNTASSLIYDSAMIYQGFQQPKRWKRQLKSEISNVMETAIGRLRYDSCMQ